MSSRNVVRSTEQVSAALIGGNFRSGKTICRDYLAEIEEESFDAG
jgi:hypothetical protein